MEDQAEQVPQQNVNEVKVAFRSKLEPPRDISIRHSLRNHFGDVVRYLYLMRFSLILWLFMIGLTIADCTEAASSTRGILTPFAGASFGNWQWFFTGFAVVLPGWFALLAARIVCAYGEERFGSAPPPCFYIFDRMEWKVFWGAQVPGAILLARIVHDSVHEGEAGYCAVVAWLAMGGCAALVFWYLISILYYWIWDPDSTIPVRAFLVPKWRLLPLEEVESLPRSASLRVFPKLVNVLRKLGDGYKMQQRTGPGHIVATIALICAVMLYLLLMPVSAPVPVPKLRALARVFGLLLSLYVFCDFLVPAYRGLHLPSSARHRARGLPFLSSLVMLLLALFGAAQPHAPRVVPVIAYVIIVLMVIFWTMAGIAFFADRFRLPVLTCVLLIVLGFNHWPAEHVFPVEPMQKGYEQTPLQDPADYVRRIAFHNNEADDDPVIIITATGGGIHAAAWTAAALQAIDQEFGHANFHNHILLLSSVSGGSVASAAFLREYFTAGAFTEASYRRIQGASACSSLQAVAWGLAYPDIIRLLFPWFFNAFPSLDRFDRGWALQNAIDRNLRDPECVPDDASRNASGPDLANFTLNAMSVRDPKGSLCQGHEDACDHLPAFTLNTTVVETGDRFLLSNYSVFAGKQGTFRVLPAASFLGVYGRETILPLLPAPKKAPPVPNRGHFADLSLLTAARLSATFTYVSPAARLPFENAQGRKQNAYHFVDGGYYDNDGTNSAIEFLKAAAQGSSDKKATFSPIRPLRVLLIEIRNSDDLDISDSPDSYAYQAGLKWSNDKQDWDSKEASSKRRFGPMDQMLAPPEAAIAAGFSSTTRRNRRELDTLQSALCNSLDLKQIVLDYQRKTKEDPATKQIISGESEVAQPLSWHLTWREKNWITGGDGIEPALDRKTPVSDRQKIREAVAWFREAQSKKGARITPSPECKLQFLDASH